MNQVATQRTKDEQVVFRNPQKWRFNAGQPLISTVSTLPEKPLTLSERIATMIAGWAANLLCVVAKPMSEQDLPDSDPAFRRPVYH